MQVRVTIAVGRKIVPLEEVKDPKIVTALRQAGEDLGAKLDAVKCPTHGKGPTDVRLHFDASGTGDIKYHSCCAELGETVSKLL